MNGIALLIGGALLVFSLLMLNVFWKLPKNTKPETVEIFNSWRNEFGLPAFVCAVPAPIAAYGISILLAGNDSTRPFAIPFQSALLFLCAVGILYFYFTKKRQITTPSPATQKVFSQMRFGAVLYGVVALTANAWIGIIAGVVVEYGPRLFKRHKE